jgi:carbon monoxide dehydrogenase subunit G
MKLEQSFEVQAPIAAVWAALTDVERVAPCLPGAEITEVGEDGTYNGTFSVKLGPATAAYRGTLKIEEVDEAQHRVVMRANGTDKRGQGGAKALMTSTVRQRDDGGTQVDVDTDFSITGRLASFSRGGMIQDISNRLLREFASCLQATLATERPAAEEAAPAEAAPAEGDPAGAAPAATEATTSAPSATAPSPAQPQPQPPQPFRPPQPAKPISGFSLFFGALMDRLRRLFRRRR